VQENLRARNEEKTSGEQQSLHRGLHVTELDSVEIEDTLTVGKYQCIQRQDLEHLKCRHQRTSTLFDDVADYNTHNFAHRQNCSIFRCTELPLLFEHCWPAGQQKGHP